MSNNPPYGGPNRPYEPYVRPRSQPYPQQQPYGGYPQQPVYQGPPPASQLPLAPVYRRAGARLIDSVIVWAFGFAVVFPIVLGAIGTSTKKDGSTETPWTSSLLVTFFVVSCVLPFL